MPLPVKREPLFRIQRDDSEATGSRLWTYSAVVFAVALIGVLAVAPALTAGPTNSTATSNFSFPTTPPPAHFATASYHDAFSGLRFRPPTTTTTTTPPATSTTTSTTTNAPSITTTSTSTTTTTTTNPAPTPPSCGGQQTLVADGSTWTCSFDSEFTGTSLDPKQWTPITTASSGYLSGAVACFMNSPNNVSVGNGYLSLTARKEAAPFVCQLPYGSFTTQYTSGTVSTYGLFSQAYGRFEVRAKVPATAVAGLQSSFWLFPQNELKYGAWPGSGEIDIAEEYSQYADRAIPYIHYNYNSATANAGTNTNIVTNYYCVINQGQFNDYVVEWTPTTMTVKFNGQTCLVDHWIPSAPLTTPQPFDSPFFLNLTQALGIATNNFNPYTTPLPATTEIQYVRAWALHS
jgi:beta-glucanase (GH16 family)